MRGSSPVVLAVLCALAAATAAVTSERSAFEGVLHPQLGGRLGSNRATPLELFHGAARDRAGPLGSGPNQTSDLIWPQPVYLKLLDNI